MQKKAHNYAGKGILPAKKLMIYMKISALFLLLALQVSATNYAQGKINLNATNTTISEVLKEIESQSSYRFNYSNDILPAQKLISIEAKNADISSVLTKVFEGLPVSWKIVEKNNIVLTPNLIEIIHGKILNDKGEPLEGASVTIKGSLVGAVSLNDGTFTINAKPDDILIISRVGYASIEVKVGSQTMISIVLSNTENKMDEVVVVGYGVQKKVNLTGSVATITNKMVEGRPMTSISAGLAGLLPGVYIRQQTGLPGGDGASIRVRGVGTLNNASPMVLVDGVESSMNDINPDDIANISVLKDAASAAIYGSKAANGVILITTKKGKKGKPVVTLSTNIGQQKATRLPEYLSSADYATLYNEALKFEGKSLKFSDDDIKKFRDGSDPYGHPNTDWLGMLYSGSGFQNINTVSISGASEYVNYMTSVNYMNQQGIIKHTGKNQYGGRANITITPSKWIETSANVSFTRENQEQPNNAYVGGGLDQIIRQVNRIAPWITYKKQDGTYGTISDGNPIAWIDQGAQINRLRNFFLGIGSVTIRPFAGFSLKGLASLKTFTEDNNELNKEIQYNPNKYHGPTKMNQVNTADERQVGEIIANYIKDFGSHNIAAMAGYHSELYKYKTTNAYRQNFPSNDLTDLNGGATDGMQNGGYTRELAMISYFGRINYAFAGKYLLEFNIRRDGSSRFQPLNRWGNFPSVSAGWRISQETFFEPVKDYINDLKLRVSWGKLGNQDALSSYYPTIPVLNLGQDYPFNSKINSGAAVVNAANASLSWEAATTKGVGLDISLMRKLNLTIDYYDRLTTGIIMTIPSPETFALNNFIDNVGKMSNKGVELNAQYNDKFGELEFSFGGNIAYNKNKILELAGQNEIISGLNIRRIGESIDAFYGYKTEGIFKTDAEAAAVNNKLYNSGTFKAGDLKYVDANGDGVVDAKDRVVLGNSVPSVNFGFNISASYKNIDLLAILNGTMGGYGYMNFDAVGGINGDAQKPAKLWMDRWTPENPNATVPRVRTGINGPNMPQTNTLSYWLRSSNYLRLKNIQLGYNFANNFLKEKGISNARIYVSSQNTFTITKFLKGWDPEAPSGRGSAYPVVMVNSIGLNISF
jgi:TonB-linked SusC/RagA family outer membrane protein